MVPETKLIMSHREIVGGQVREVGVVLSSLQRIRQEKLWTQAELAQTADISRPTVANAERGQKVGLRSARKLALALGVTLEDLQRPKSEAT